MITEQQLQEGLQTIIREITGTFASASVGIMTWGLLDGSTGNAPYFIIDNTDDFGWNQAPARQTGRVTIPAWLGVPFLDWESSGIVFRNARQAVIGKFDGTDDAASFNGLAGVSLSEIRPLTPVSYMPIDPNVEDSLPLFIYQLLGFVVELF